MDSVNGIAGNSTNPFSDISGPTSEPSGDSKNSRPPTSPRQREGVQGLPKRNNTPPLQSQGASAEEAEAIGESSAVAPKAASEPPTEPQTRNGSPVPQGPTKTISRSLLPLPVKIKLGRVMEISSRLVPTRFNLVSKKTFPQLKKMQLQQR